MKLLTVKCLFKLINTVSESPSVSGLSLRLKVLNVKFIMFSFCKFNHMFSTEVIRLIFLADSRIYPPFLRSVSGDWSTGANRGCCGWWRHPAVSRGASAQCGETDGGVVEARPPAWPKRSAEPGRIRACLPGHPRGSGHEDVLVRQEDVAVRRWPETWRHIAQDHQRDACRRREIQVLHPEVAAQPAAVFNCSSCCLWVKILFYQHKYL